MTNRRIGITAAPGAEMWRASTVTDMSANEARPNAGAADGIAQTTVREPFKHTIALRSEAQSSQFARRVRLGGRRIGAGANRGCAACRRAR